jgi:hypothetical protein
MLNCDNSMISEMFCSYNANASPFSVKIQLMSLHSGAT